MLKASSIKPQGKVPYIWRDRFPVGAVSVLAGLEASGKSLLTAGITAEVSNSSGPVIFGNEEDPLRISRSRITVAGGQLDRVYFPEVGYQFPDDLSRFEDDVADIKPKLCIFDAASQHLPYLSNDQSVRKALTPLSWMAEEYKMAIIFVAHTLRSARRGQDIKTCIQGPALTRAARVLAIMGELPPVRPGALTPSNLRGLAFVKDSFREKPDGLLLSLDSKKLAGAEVAYVQVEGEQYSFDPHELLGANAARSGWQPRRRAA